MPDLFNETDSSAIISKCGRYRYLLTRTWDKTIPPLCWIMLNPSTADAYYDDPTIRRCVFFSKKFGYGGLRVVNLYALRATSPRELWVADDPVGPDNDQAIIDGVAGEMTVVAYGANAKSDRERFVYDLIYSNALAIECLGFTKGNKPKHPLYLPNTAERRSFSPSYPVPKGGVPR